MNPKIDDEEKRPVIYVYGGGTVSHVRPHLALCAPAYGATMHQIADLICEMREESAVGKDPEYAKACAFYKEAVFRTMPTKMAAYTPIHNPELNIGETNEDVWKSLQETVLPNPNARVVFMSAALCDFDGTIVEWKSKSGEMCSTGSGKRQPRLKTADGARMMSLLPAEKVIGKIRQERKDIFLVGFKTTTGARLDEMFVAGLGLLKTASCNLVLVNDLHERVNMIVTPEEVPYAVTTNRHEALRELVTMVGCRTQLHFTRSTVVEGQRVSWGSNTVPANLRKVVEYCIGRNAYKSFMGKTVGHFAFRSPEGPGKFVTSIRKSNFNHLGQGTELDSGMVRIETKGEDEIVAFGAKPSVGGQSQRRIFEQHPDVDCIVHFHCPLKDGVDHEEISVRPQKPYECGSHECGQNTSDGLREHDSVSFDGKRVPLGGKLKAVFLDGHGPNIAFSKDVSPEAVIAFIQRHFDLSRSTGDAALWHVYDKIQDERYAAETQDLT